MQRDSLGLRSLALTSASAFALLSTPVPVQAQAVNCNTPAGLLALAVGPVVVRSLDVDDNPSPILTVNGRTQVFLRPPATPPAQACTRRISMRLLVARTSEELTTNMRRAVDGRPTPATNTFRVVNARLVGPVNGNPNLIDFRAEVPRSQTFPREGQRVFYRWLKVIDNSDRVAQDGLPISVAGPEHSFITTAPPAAPQPPQPQANLEPEMVGNQVPFVMGGGNIGNTEETYIAVDDRFCSLQGAARLREESVTKPLLGSGTRAVVQPPPIAWRLRNTGGLAVPANVVITSEAINRNGTTANLSFQVNGIAANTSVPMPPVPRQAVEVWQFPQAGGSGCFAKSLPDGSNPFPECIHLEVDTVPRPNGAVNEPAEGQNNILRFGCR
jgi:hypothetical protein